MKINNFYLKNDLSNSSDFIFVQDEKPPEIKGCTNENSPNYNSEATCDDGSCITCCNQGFCGPPERTDLNIENGYCDEVCVEFEDCSPSYLNSFSALSCDGFSDIIYESCIDCRRPKYVFSKFDNNKIEIVP
jgi:hypothetical protein